MDKNKDRWEPEARTLLKKALERAYNEGVAEGVRQGYAAADSFEMQGADSPEIVEMLRKKALKLQKDLAAAITEGE